MVLEIQPTWPGEPLRVHTHTHIHPTPSSGKAPCTPSGASPPLLEPSVAKTGHLPVQGLGRGSGWNGGVGGAAPCQGLPLPSRAQLGAAPSSSSPQPAARRSLLWARLGIPAPPPPFLTRSLRDQQLWPPGKAGGARQGQEQAPGGAMRTGRASRQAGRGGRWRRDPRANFPGTAARPLPGPVPRREAAEGSGPAPPQGALVPAVNWLWKQLSPSSLDCSQQRGCRGAAPYSPKAAHGGLRGSAAERRGDTVPPGLGWGGGWGEASPSLTLARPRGRGRLRGE